MNVLVVEFHRPAYVDRLLALFNRYDTVTLNGDNLEQSQQALRYYLLKINGVWPEDKSDRLDVHCSGAIAYIRALKLVKAFIKQQSTSTTITLTHFNKANA